MLLLYLAWFRITFGIKGVVPTMNLWKDPERTSTLVVITGLVILGIAYVVGRIEFFPEPGGLVLTLVGLLVTTNGVYVWLSSAGPLAGDYTVVNEVFSEDDAPLNDDAIKALKAKADGHENDKSVNHTYNIQNISITDSVVVDSKFNNHSEEE